MEYARWSAEMSAAPEEGSAPVSAHLAMRARKGAEWAVARLDGPEYPVVLEYLWLASREMFGRSGVTEGGFAPLTYRTILDYQAAKRVQFSPLDVEGLIRTDDAYNGRLQEVLVALRKQGEKHSDRGPQ